MTGYDAVGPPPPAAPPAVPPGQAAPPPAAPPPAGPGQAAPPPARPGQVAPNPGGLRAVLWDMDGLLVDSEPLWTIAETELATRLGRTWTAEVKAAIIGHRLDTAVPRMLAGLGAPTDGASVAEAAAFLLARMVELFTTSPLPLLPGARSLLAVLAAAGVPCALVSSSFRVLVDAVLASLGEHPFAVTVAGDEVTRGKPDPEPYRVAAARLGVDPACCVVLEDSLSGAVSGVAAGCVTVLIAAAAPATPAGPDAPIAAIARTAAPSGEVQVDAWVRLPTLTALDLGRLETLAAGTRGGSGQQPTRAS